MFRLPFFLVALALVTMVGCNLASDSTPSEITSTTGVEIPDAINTPDSLILSKVTDLDSLVEALMPLLLSDPTSRKFDLWFERKNLWEPQIGSTKNLTVYVTYIHDLLLYEGKMGQAAIVATKKGRLLYASGLYPEALDAFKESLTAANSIGDSVAIGWAYMGMASSSFRMADSTDTYLYMERAKDIASRTPDKGLQLTTGLTAAGIEGSLGINDNVIPEMQQLLAQARENKFYELEKIGSLNLSYIYYLSGEYDSSINLLLSNPQLNAGPITLNNTFLNYNLYEAYTGKGDNEKAFTYLQKGCEIADSLEFAYGLNFCKLSRYEYYQRIEDYPAALAAFEDYHNLYKQQSGLIAQQKLQQAKAELGFYNQQFKIERLSRIESEQKREYQYRRNILYGTIACLTFIFILLYQRLRYSNKISLADQKRDVAETKLQVLQSQIQPHFIFNVITGIQNRILKSDTLNAYNYLGKFASLLRILTNSGTSISILIDKEVELIENYLALEKLRFRDDFVYSVDIEEGLLKSNYSIPGMMIQPMVENAIIHGVSNLPYQGKITVSIKQQGDGVEVLVTDNGRGREEALQIARKDSNKHLSIASGNREASLKYLRTIGYENANITVKDLKYPDGSPKGTQVLLFLPFYHEN